MGVNASKQQLKNNVSNSVKRMQSVEFDVAGRRFVDYQSFLADFLDGFFLNEDLECAFIRGCYDSFWGVFAMTEKACNGTTKYRIIQKWFTNTSRGSDNGWAVVKIKSDLTLDQLGLYKTEMEIAVDYDAIHSRKELFEKLISQFLNDIDCKKLILKSVNTSDFKAVLKILTEVSNLFPAVALERKTDTNGVVNKESFDYIVAKKDEKKEKETASWETKHQNDADYVYNEK